MARLYPPNIAGTLPSFYGNNLVIPYTMNKVVSVASVAGFALRVKSAATETLLFLLNTTEEGTSAYFDTTSVTFVLSSTILNKLRIGEYYKIQLAYVANQEDDLQGQHIIGYFSSTSIIKYTGAPKVEIQGFDEISANTSPGVVVGEYSNPLDYSEKDYEYRFILTIDKTTIIDDTGWRTHYSGTDVEVVEDGVATRFLEQIDQYTVKYTLDSNNIYYIRYMVRTNNDLYVNSPWYEIVELTPMDSTLLAELYAELDYDNACIILKLVPYVNAQDAVLVGTFEVGRAEAIDDFKIWTIINSFSLNGRLPKEGRIFTDFTIEQGLQYKYAIRQKNANGVYSSWMPVVKWRRKKAGYLTYDENDADWAYSSIVEASFEDAFLFDGDKQLRIRFNPKVSSFKTVISDTKKVAIGNKYPYFFRNGIVAYKEFPISGLISYLSDENEYFMLREKDLGMDYDWQDSTDITDENLIYERRFKMAVLDWLNEDNVKLFKSPGEGNYIVRISNVSLQPNDSLSRMLHTFTCTATEISDFNIDTLLDYNFLTVEEDTSSLTLFLTTLLTREEDGTPSITSDYDLFEYLPGVYLKFENFLPGSTFKLNNLDIMIGETGQYEAYLETPVNRLYLSDATIRNNITKNNTYTVPSVTVGVQSKGFTNFDLVQKVTGKLRLYVRAVGDGVSNILEPYTDLKHSISKIYYLRLSPVPLVDTGFTPQALQKYVNEANAAMAKAGITTDQSAALMVSGLDTLCVYKTISENEETGLGDIKYYKVVFLTNKFKMVELNGYDTTALLGVNRREVYNEYGVLTYVYDDLIVNVDHVTTLTYKNLDYIPSDSLNKPYIKLGNGVVAELGIFLTVITYDIESDITGILMKISEKNRKKFPTLKKNYLTAVANFEGDNDTESAISRLFTGKINDTQYNSLKRTYDTNTAAYLAVLNEEIENRLKEAG